MARNETRCTLQQRQWRSFFITGFGIFLPASRGVFDYRHDTLDDFSLPQQGIYFDLEYLISKDSFDGSNPLSGDALSSDTVSELSGRLIAAHTFSRHTLVANLDMGW